MTKDVQIIAYESAAGWIVSYKGRSYRADDVLAPGFAGRHRGITDAIAEEMRQAFRKAGAS